MVLVRQPFPDAKLMYKNVLAKMTEVRTWTECLVKLVDSGPSHKRLVFYNAHELMSLAAEREIPLDEVIAGAVADTDDSVRPGHDARDFYREDAPGGQSPQSAPQQQREDKEVYLLFEF